MVRPHRIRAVRGPAACARQQHLQVGTAERLREPARRQGREFTRRLAALDEADFNRLAPDDADVVSSYYGLAGNRPSTKKELAGRFGLSLWHVESRLKHSVATLLAPDSDGALSCEARRERKRARISQLRRERGRPCASVLRDLRPETFDRLGALERELVRLYYGIAQERAWSRRELSREFGLSTGRIEDLVNTAVTHLTGVDVAPRFDRLCVLCGGRFTVRSRLSRRGTCDFRCETELKRWARARHRQSPSKTDRTRANTLTLDPSIQ